MSVGFCRGSRVEGKMSRVEGKMSRVEGKMSRLENKMSRVEGKMSRVQKYVWKLVSRFFRVDRKTQRSVQAFPLFSAFRTFSLFICACDSEFIILVVEGLLKAFSFLSFFFFNFPF